MDISKKFLKDYTLLLPHIHKIIETYSGTHSINKEKAQQWIDSQPNQSSKRAAKIIIDNTKYITLKNTATLAKNIITTHYKEIVEKHPKKTIYFVCGDRKKSNYWLSILALSYIKQYKLREPDYYFYLMDKTFEDPNNLFIYYDDMSYSGGQIYSFINKYVTIRLQQKIALYLGTYSFEHNKQMIRDKIENSEKNILDYENNQLKYAAQIQELETQLQQVFDDSKTSNIKSDIESIQIDQSWVKNFIERTKNEIEILKKDLLIIDNKTYDELYNSNFTEINRLTKRIIISETNESRNTLQQFLDNFEYPNLYYLLIGINKNAYEKISIVPYTYMGKTYIVKPFKIFYGQKFITIDELVEGGVILEEDVFYMSYYFSQGLTPNILLYFDHKIADEPSTFLRLYNYGYVVPTNFDTVNYEPRYEQFLDQRRQGHSLNYVQSQFYKLFKKYYHTREITNGPQDITQPIKFIPFINNCFNVEKIIQHPLIIYVNYFILITDMNAELIPGAIKNDDLIPGAIKNDDLSTAIEQIIQKNQKKNINPDDKKFIDIIFKLEESKYSYYNYGYADIYFLILKMFFLRQDNIYKNMDINKMLDERPPDFDHDNIDINLFNLPVIQKYIDVCKLILLIRDHRCELSFYKFDIAEYAQKLETEEDFLENEVPFIWPWENPFKNWRKNDTEEDFIAPMVSGETTTKKPWYKFLGGKKTRKHKKNRKTKGSDEKGSNGGKSVSNLKFGRKTRRRSWHRRRQRTRSRK